MTVEMEVVVVNGDSGVLNCMGAQLMLWFFFSVHHFITVVCCEQMAKCILKHSRSHRNPAVLVFFLPNIVIKFHNGAVCAGDGMKIF